MTLSDVLRKRNSACPVSAPIPTHPWPKLASLRLETFRSARARPLTYVSERKKTLKQTKKGNTLQFRSDEHFFFSSCLESSTFRMSSRAACSLPIPDPTGADRGRLASAAARSKAASCALVAAADRASSVSRPSVRASRSRADADTPRSPPSSSAAVRWPRMSSWVGTSPAKLVQARVDRVRTVSSNSRLWSRKKNTFSKKKKKKT